MEMGLAWVGLECNRVSYCWGEAGMEWWRGWCWIRCDPIPNPIPFLSILREGEEPNWIRRDQISGKFFPFPSIPTQHMPFLAFGHLSTFIKTFATASGVGKWYLICSTQKKVRGVNAALCYCGLITQL